MSYPARYRPPSPSRYIIDPMRASTGTVQLSSSYDPYDFSANRYGYTPYPSDYYYHHTYAPHLNHERRLEAHPVSSTAYRDPGHSTKLRTEYTVRPRRRSSTTSGADPGAKESVQSSLDARSPVVTSGYRRSPSPLPSETERYLVPASPRHAHRHRRVYSTDYASDTGRLGPQDAVTRHRPGHSVYRVHAPGGRKRYPTARELRRGSDIDDHDAYSYTTPREQFENESVARLKYRRDAHRRERPMSMNGVEEYFQPFSKEPRAHGPPPSQRGFDRLERDTRSRRSVHEPRDDGAAREEEGSRQLTQHLAPLSLHHDDDGYSSYKEDYVDGYHRRHRRPRRHDDNGSRQAHDERSRLQHRDDSSVPDPGTGLGAAGLASGYSDDFNYHSPRGDHHHSRDPDRRHGRNAADVRESEHRSRDHQSRRHRQVDRDSDASAAEETTSKYKRAPSAHRKYSESETSSNKETPSQHLTVENSRHRRSSRSRHRAEDDRTLRVPSQQGSTSGQEDISKSLTVDSPSAKQPEASPKGILKQPRDKFPEEPNPIREGVAPLKDAHKKGIPPGARWTKIDRRLVNPAALEAGRERFEERASCVIVLRVLTKEEIQAYAAKTQEIRGKLVLISNLYTIF